MNLSPDERATLKYVIISVVGILLLTWVIQGNNFFLFKFWAPKMENVRRETFENTQSYVEGKRQELVKLRLEYIREQDPIAKKAIKQTIAESFANFDESKITEPELRGFLHEMKYAP